MAVILRILNIDTPENVEHIATDWQVATDLLFSNVILSSIEDSVNKTTIVFNKVLDPTIKYYARARPLLSPTGYGVWGNIDVFLPKDINDVALDMDMPTPVSIPVLTTDSNSNFHAPTLFSITANGFSAKGTAKHESTTWIIEDIDGKVVWKRDRDIINKTQINIVNTVLKADTIYNIRAVFHSTSSDVSQVATMTICVGNNKYAKVLSVLNDIDVSKSLEIKIADRPGVVDTEWKIVNLENDIATTILSLTGSIDNVLKIELPANILRVEESYIVMVKTNLDELWSYFSFSTY